MQELKRHVGLVLLLLLPAVLYGQATVKGFLRSKESGEPVMFASVSLEGTSFGVMSDIEGFYSLSRVPAGSYTLVISSMEYEGVNDESCTLHRSPDSCSYSLQPTIDDGIQCFRRNPP